MNMLTAVLRRYRSCCLLGHPSLWWIGLLMMLLPALNVAFALAANGSARSVEIQPLVHFRDASHDWLLVVDPATRELVVYDASSGRPLKRLGADEGLAGVKSMACEGAKLLVTTDRQPTLRVLMLPDFMPVAINDR